MDTPMVTRRLLARDVRGLALIEFGLALPVLMVLCCSGLELVNYIVTKLRISQVALQVADNASRMGAAVNGVKTVTEANIAETFIGGKLQAGNLDLLTNGRIILSSLEPKTNPNTTPPKYKIQWQRCYGNQITHASTYGVQGDTDMDGMGPATRQVVAQANDAVMYVEVYYKYDPLFSLVFPASQSNMVEIAAMAVRDPRSLGVLPTSSGTVASC